METLKKIMQSRTPGELLSSITYSSLKKLSFLMLVVFVINSNIKMFANIINMDVLGSFYWVFWSYYNRYMLLFSIILLTILVLKCKQDAIVLNIKGTLKSNPAFILFLIFSAIMTISTIINGKNIQALIGEGYCAEGLIGYLSYIFYFFMAIYVLDQKYQSKFIKIFIFSASINLFATIFDYICLNKKYNFVTGNTIFFNSNHYGYYLLVVAVALGLLFIYARTLFKKLIYLMAFAVTIGVLLVNNTLGCQLALLLTLLFICIVYSITKGKFKPITLLLLVVFFATYVFGYSFSDTIKFNINSNFFQLQNDTSYVTSESNAATEETTGTIRLNLWKHTIEYIFERPILGFAAEGTADRLYMATNESRCHNDYLNYAVCYGIPASIIYIVAVFMIFLRGLKYKNKLTDINLLGLCCAFAYLVSAFLGNSMFYTAPFLFIMLGLGYYQNKENVSD